MDNSGLWEWIFGSYNFEGLHQRTKIKKCIQRAGKWWCTGIYPICDWENTNHWTQNLLRPPKKGIATPVASSIGMRPGTQGKAMTCGCYRACKCEHVAATSSHFINSPPSPRWCPGQLTLSLPFFFPTPPRYLIDVTACSSQSLHKNSCPCCVPSQRTLRYQPGPKQPFLAT